MNKLLENRRLPVWLLGAAMLLAIPLIVHFQRGIGITRDEWQFLLHRNSLSPSVLVEAFNGHFMPFTTVFLRLEQILFGEPARWPIAVVSIAAHLSIVWLSFAYMRTRIGEWWAAAGALLILFLGTGYEVIVWPFNSGWILAMAAGIAAVIVSERPDSTRTRVTAALLLALSFTGNNIGSVFAVAIAVGILYKDSRRKAIAITAIPFGLFVIWWLLKAGDGSDLHIKEWPNWIATMIEGTGDGLLGHTPGTGVSNWGAPVALLAIGAGALELGRRREISHSLATALIMPLGFIALVTFGRGGRYDPTASRYVYTLFVLALLALAEIYRGRRMENAGMLLFVAPLVAFCIAGNIVVMSQGAFGIRVGSLMDKEYATATLRVGKDVADKVSSNQGDFLFVPGDTPALYRWISDPSHRKYAFSEAELATDPATRGVIETMEKQMRAEAAKAAKAQP